VWPSSNKGALGCLATHSLLLLLLLLLLLVVDLVEALQGVLDGWLRRDWVLGWGGGAGEAAEGRGTIGRSASHVPSSLRGRLGKGSSCVF
jgi:hypothetical protein